MPNTLDALRLGISGLGKFLDPEKVGLPFTCEKTVFGGNFDHESKNVRFGSTGLEHRKSPSKKNLSKILHLTVKKLRKWR